MFAHFLALTRNRSCWVALACALLLTATGCGGGGSSSGGNTTGTAPSITTQPQNQSVSAGQTATFTVTATGTVPLSYQWKKGANAISGATSASYTTPTTTAGDNGASFTVTVSNSAGNVTSNAATLTVTTAATAPTIATQPQSVSATVGSDATFTVVAAGTAPLGYQWKKGTTNVGTNAATLTLSNVQAADAGDYTVTVSNNEGSVTSDAAILTLTTATGPTITSQPLNTSVTAGSNAFFMVTATGPVPLAYQWKKGTANVGTNSPLLTLANVHSADAGSYTVSVSNGAGSVNSSAATLTVNAATAGPRILIQPRSHSVMIGNRAGFFVQGEEPDPVNDPLSYQWKKGVTNIGTNSPELIINTSAQISDAGQYSVTVTNLAGSTPSAAASLTVVQPEVIVCIPNDVIRLRPSETYDFTASVMGTSNTAVTLSVQEAAGGSINASGHYSAPATEGAYHVIATSVADTRKTYTAVIYVSATMLIPPDRLTEWNPGLNAVGGIPTNRAIYNATALVPSGGDDTTAIQALLNACPENQVVQLAAGTFTVNNLLLLSKGITLRGAGAGQTILQKTNGAKPDDNAPADSQPILIIGPGRWVGSDDNTSQGLTADAKKGDTFVTVPDGSAFKAGDYVLLDELSGATWVTDRLPGRGQVWASPDYRSVWQVHNPALAGDDPAMHSDDFYDEGGAAAWFCRLDRVRSEMKQVDHVTGNTVFFNTPVHIDYRADNQYQAQLTGYTNAGNGGIPVAYAGIEGLTVTGGSDAAIRFNCAAYCWVKDVEVTLWLGEGINLANSFRCVVRDSYVHDGAWPYPGGGGYAISMSASASENLIENNIFVRANKVMVARCSGTASVFGYNYADEGFIAYNGAWMECGLNASHMIGPHHVLFEGNYGFNWDSDHTHGNSIYHTVFRNWLRGIRKPFTSSVTGTVIDDIAQDAGPARCIGALAYSSWMAFIGNVLGAQGQMNGWQLETQLMTDGPGIWMLGWDDRNDGHPLAYDPVTVATETREGNWDWLQSQQSWEKVTAGTPLPDSLYLTTKPAFFGSNTWPWVDPITGATGTLPAKARFDAMGP